MFVSEAGQILSRKQVPGLESDFARDLLKDESRQDGEELRAFLAKKKAQKNHEAWPDKQEGDHRGMSSNIQTPERNLINSAWTQAVKSGRMGRNSKMEVLFNMKENVLEIFDQGAGRKLVYPVSLWEKGKGTPLKTSYKKAPLGADVAQSEGQAW